MAVLPSDCLALTSAIADERQPIRPTQQASATGAAGPRQCTATLEKVCRFARIEWADCGRERTPLWEGVLVCPISGAGGALLYKVGILGAPRGFGETGLLIRSSYPLQALAPRPFFLRAYPGVKGLALPGSRPRSALAQPRARSCRGCGRCGCLPMPCRLQPAAAAAQR